MGHRGSIRYIILGFDIEVMLVFVNYNSGFIRKFRLTESL